MSKKRVFWDHPRWCSKMKVEKNVELLSKLFKVSLASNIIVGHSFDITIYAPKLWSMSGHYTLGTAGRLFKKCWKICQKCSKIASEAHFLWQNVVFYECNKNLFFSEKHLMCMNFIRLRGLSSGTRSGHWRARLRCIVEFGHRAKTEISYFSTHNSQTNVKNKQVTCIGSNFFINF